MATHPSILAWRIPETEEPGGLRSMVSQSWTWLSDIHFYFKVKWGHKGRVLIRYEWFPCKKRKMLERQPQREELWAHSQKVLSCKKRREAQFSHSVMSNSLWPHGLEHTRLPCPSPTPRACSNSCPLSQWYHSTISSSVIPFSSCLQSFPAWGLFKWFSSSCQVAEVLELQLQHQSFQWTFRTDFL